MWQRKLEICTEETNILVFNRKERKMKMERNIQEIQIFKYLGFNFNKERNYSEYIKEMKKKDRTETNKGIRRKNL